MELNGQKLKRGAFLTGYGRGFKFDLYLATDETWATLLLIRTGSKEHNIRLCKIAQAKGGKLHADGSGVRDDVGDLFRCVNELDVFRALGMDYVDPCNRE